jgi:dihydrofolate reductase
VSRLLVRSFSLSQDGFGAGPDQSLEQPLGLRGPEIMAWAFPTRTMRARVFGQDGGETGVDDAMVERGFDGIGAWILGRNMFGPIRGPWPDDRWKGWWGDEPPYHVPVFVLTHHARALLPMAGGTTFHFVTGGLGEALDRAREASGGRDVRLGGGVATLRAAFRARLVDEAHFAVGPVLLGRGEAVFAGLDLDALGYEVERTVAGERATHVFVHRKA